MARGWFGEPGRHALARKGISMKIPRKPHRAIHKSLIVSSKEYATLKAVEKEAEILEKQIEERRYMLSRLQSVIDEARETGKKEIERRAELLQEEMLRDIEMRLNKLQNDIKVLEREHPKDYHVKHLGRQGAELAFDYMALEFQYGGE